MSHETDIAIVGMSGRFPGANSIEAFWNNISRGVCALEHFPASHNDDPTDVQVRGIIKDIEQFDRNFFNFSQTDAEILDPQQRLLLECAWEALADAGISPDTTDHTIGVFAGTSLSTYLFRNLLPNTDLTKRLGTAAVFQANMADHCATRIAYKLGLRGPAVTVQTACSTSLVAVHHGCQSLLSGDSDIVLAGGASIIVPQERGYQYAPGGILSRSGACLPFDRRADGTVFSNGVGIVVLQRLDDALRQQSNITAVIRSVAINNDGGKKASYAAPSARGQADVIRSALELADVHPESVGFIETHGTGTTLGDAVEMCALHDVFGNRKTPPCAIGALKGAIGHLDAAAGVVALIKTALCLFHDEIPPNAYFHNVSPEINFDPQRFCIPTTPHRWSTAFDTRYAGVSAFGVGGTNVHAVLTQPPVRKTRPITSPNRRQLFLVSGHTQSALNANLAALTPHLEARPDLSIANIAHTLQCGRQHFSERQFAVVTDRLTAVDTLKNTKARKHTRQRAQSGVIFVFPGQGVHFTGLTQPLYQHEPVFRAAIDRCDEIFSRAHQLSLLDVLHNRKQHDAWGTDIAQPALFSLQYALAQQWISWGVQPQTLLGHSLGEYTAACIAGVFSLETALELLIERGRLIHMTAEGQMLAVALSPVELKPLLQPLLSIAAINGPKQCVVSGDRLSVEAFEQTCLNKEIPCHKLASTRAFHSDTCTPILNAYHATIANHAMQPPAISWVSTLTGKAQKEAPNTEYWVRQLREPVLFWEALQSAVESTSHHHIILEIGPGQTLTRLTQPLSQHGRMATSVSGLVETSANLVEDLWQPLGQLWLEGVPINWQHVQRDRGGHRVTLPAYCFERQRCWIDPPNPPTSTADVEVDQPCSSNPTTTAEITQSTQPVINTPSLVAPDAPLARIEQTLLSLAHELLGVTDMQPSDNFFAMGANSLMAVQILSRLKATFDVEISMVDFYRAETISALARVIGELILAQIEES